MPIDIAFSLNRTLQTPLLVVINSILQNASWPAAGSGAGSASSDDQIRFNILVPPGDQDFFEAQLKAAFPAHTPSSADPNAQNSNDQNSNDQNLNDQKQRAIFRVREFTPPDFLKHYLDSKFKEQRPDRRISRYMQYARFFLKPMFPDVSRVIYLDGDTLVLGDVRELFAQGSRLTPDTYLAAVPQLFPAMFYFSNPFKIWGDLRQFKNTFNSGVLLTDLSLWNEQTYDALRHYLDLDAKNSYKLYNLGDETVFNLIFKRTYLELAQKWNCWGYGQPHWISRILTLKCNLKTVKIIHWSGGHHKPWHSDRVTYSKLWRSYLPALGTQPTLEAPVETV
jgi:lipopolysaccharide biosynthesis glycosyltransferase